MKTSLLTLALIFNITIGYCQWTFKSADNSNPWDSIFKRKFTHNENVISIKGRNFNRKGPASIKIKFTNKDNVEIWNVTINKHDIENRPNLEIVYSKYAECFYIIEGFPSKKISENNCLITENSYINQIDYNGNIKSVEFKNFIKEEFPQIAVVLTKNNLNILSRNEDKVILNKFNHFDLTFKSIELPITCIYTKKAKSTSSFWHYTGQTEDKIYLAKKIYGGFVDKNDYTYKYFISSINEDGIIQENITLDSKLTDCYAVAACSMKNNGAWESNFQTMFSASTTDGSRQTVVYVNTISNLEIDVEKNNIYVYGIMSRKYIKPDKSVAAQNKPNGCYIQKFDFQGNKKWQIIKEFEDKYQNSIANMPGNRTIQFKNNILNIFSYSLNNGSFGMISYEVSDSGEIINLLEKNKDQ